MGRAGVSVGPSSVPLIHQWLGQLDMCTSCIQGQPSDWSDLQGDQLQGQEHLPPVVQDISKQPNLCGQRGQEGLGVGAAADHQDDKQL